MRETVEFRVVEEFAPLLFAEEEGKQLGELRSPIIRKIVLATTDSRYARVGSFRRT